MQLKQQRFLSHPAVTFLGVAIAIGLCLWTVKSTATLGLSRLFVRYSVGMRNLAAANEAVRLTPVDPEAHLAHAEILMLANMPNESLLELERAVALRPSDYRLWLSLGLLRDQMGNPTAALAAFDEAVKRAPFYSQPRWQRGNLLLRTGQYDAAFKDLNLAVQSDPELIPNFIDLAWGMSKGDPKLTEQLAQITTDKMRIAFARFLARRGKATEAVAQFRTIEMVPIEVRRELVEQLLAKGAFKEGFAVWQGDQTIPPGSSIYDGGFEAALTFDQGGFGWRVPRTLPAVTLGLDSSKAHSGSKSLKIEFSGDSNPSLPPISQLILVEPAGHYRISFAARSQEIVSGGLPMLFINDAADKKVLGQSAALSKGSRDWQVVSFEFKAQPATAAVLLSLQRENCTTAPCPAFGSIWLDSFSVEQLR